MHCQTMKWTECKSLLTPVCMVCSVYSMYMVCCGSSLKWTECNPAALPQPVPDRLLQLWQCRAVAVHSSQDIDGTPSEDQTRVCEGGSGEYVPRPKRSTQLVAAAGESDERSSSTAAALQQHSQHSQAQANTQAEH